VTAPACWLCGGTTEDAVALRPHPFRRCTACGFVFRPDGAGVHEVYESGGYAEVRGTQYERESGHRRRDARVRLRWLAPHAAGGVLLDVGAAGGEFVAEAAAAGFDARGVEPTPSFAARARDVLGVDVSAGTLEELELAPESLDVVTMWHVLEHVPDPLPQLRRIRDALRPGGVLAVEVPNAGGVIAARMGTAWPPLEPDVHVSQFAPPTLRALLGRAGLEPAEIGTVTLTPYLPPAARLHPRHVLARARLAAWLREPRTRHPSGHELLRAVARRP
jgi:SAM-dependent methyltransferase